MPTFGQDIADFITSFATFLALLARCITFEAVLTSLEIEHSTLVKKNFSYE